MVFYDGSMPHRKVCFLCHGGYQFPNAFVNFVIVALHSLDQYDFFFDDTFTRKNIKV